MKIGVGAFKAKCLKLIDNVQKYHEEIIITKRGVPAARVVPINPKEGTVLFGMLEGTAVAKDDLVAPSGEKWEADES